MYYTYLPYIEYSKLKNLDAAYRDIECFKITLTKKYVCFFKNIYYQTSILIDLVSVVFQKLNNGAQNLLTLM